jgi:hypothetical protein
MRLLRLISSCLLFPALLGASLSTTAAADGWRHDDDGWGRPHWGRGHWDHGGEAASAALGGFALGAVAGAASRPYDASYGHCYFVERPVTDDWGNILEYRRSQVCD